MTSATNSLATYTLTVGPPAVIIVLNPYMMYLVLFCFMATCILICIHIINNCAKRNQRLDKVATRAIRRAHAKSADCEH